MRAAEPHASASYARAGLLIGVALSLIVCAAFAGHWLLIGSVKGGWFYGYAQPLTWRIFLVSLMAGAIVAALLWLIPDRRDWLWLIVWMAAAVAVQAAVQSIHPFPLETLFVSDSSNSFYTLSQQHEPLDVLSRFNRIRAQAPLHAQSNMPGKVMLIYALEPLSARPDVLAWLIVLVSNLGAIFMYLFVRDVADRRTALFAAVLYLLVPARLYFLPIMNTVTPTVALCCAWVFTRWLGTRQFANAILFGLTLYGLVFFEPLPLVMGLLFAALAAAAVRRGDLTWDRFLLQAAVVVVTFIAVAEAMAFVFGFELIDALRRIGTHAVEFNVHDGRPYSVWVYANVVEFVVGMGVCQAVLFCAAIAARALPVVTCGLLSTVIVTDLIGINRGEVIRLWLFLACLCQIPAAFVCASLPGRQGIAVASFCSALQAALGAALIRFVVP